MLQYTYECFSYSNKFTTWYGDVKRTVSESLSTARNESTVIKLFKNSHMSNVKKQHNILAENGIYIRIQYRS